MIGIAYGDEAFKEAGRQRFEDFGEYEANRPTHYPTFEDYK